MIFIQFALVKGIKIILHREIEGKIKTCTIKKDIDQWYRSSKKYESKL